MSSKNHCITLDESILNKASSLSKELLGNDKLSNIIAFLIDKEYSSKKDKLNSSLFISDEVLLKAGLPSAHLFSHLLDFSLLGESVISKNYIFDKAKMSLYKQRKCFDILIQCGFVTKIEENPYWWTFEVSKRFIDSLKTLNK